MQLVVCVDTLLVPASWDASVNYPFLSGGFLGCRFGRSGLASPSRATSAARVSTAVVPGLLIGMRPEPLGPAVGGG